MATKQKLKRKLKKQSIQYRLALSDATIEIEKLDYELALYETMVNNLKQTNKDLLLQLEEYQKAQPSTLIEELFTTAK